MFEVLLAADKALASGALDQAERSYWQLVELDPTNAIAVIGLARVSLERGDHRLARTFAERALAMDPESASAKKILAALNDGPIETAEEPPDLPLLAAQRLEALGRRRAASAEDEADLPRPGDEPGKRGTTGEDEPRDSMPLLPSEPLPDRRQAGRQAAAAAAAAAEAAPRASLARPKAHQALGDRARRNLLPEDLKPRPRANDPFAAAETAAAIEAVDETDDVAIEEHPTRTGRTSHQPVHAAGRARGSAPDAQGDVLGAVDATDEDESVAMRIALVADAATLEAAETHAATYGAIDAQDEDESIAMRIALVSDGATLDAAELDAPELDAAELDAPKLDAAEPDAAEFDAAELQAAALDEAAIDEGVLGVAELVAAAELGPEKAPKIDLDAIEADLEAAELRIAARNSARRGSVPLRAQEVDEESAEAAALREALDMVLDGDAPTQSGSHVTGGGKSPLPGAEVPAERDTDTETFAREMLTSDPDAKPEPRRKGLLRRFRGD